MGSAGSVSPSGLVPVFPLPRVVFFPRTVLNLHVFEPRYRAMVQDAASGEGLIAVSLLKPGWEEGYEGNPAFHHVATVGRIQDLERHADGKFDMRLVGLERVRLGEVIRDTPYRVVRARLIREVEVDEDAPEARTGKLDLLASHGCLLRELAEEGESPIVLDERIPFETAINGACANLPVDPEIRQSLLEEDRMMERYRRVAELQDEVLQRVLHLRAMRSRDEGGSGLN